MKFVRASLVAFFIGAIPHTVGAEFVKPSYTYMVRNLLDMFTAIADARGLSNSQKTIAQHDATAWMYIAPCQGIVSDRDRKYLDVSLGQALDPKYTVDAAILEMIASMYLEDFGRGPSPEICKFAYELAVPYQLLPPPVK